MKKLLMFLGFAVVVLLLGSCASADPGESIPDWVLNPPLVSDGYYGVGYAKQSTLPLSIKLAETRARADIANQIRVTIQEVVSSYAQESGVGSETQLLEFVEVATRQVTDQAVSGAVIVNRHVMNDGGVWVMGKYDTNSMRNLVAQAVEDTADQFSRSEAAAFSEWKAKQAFEYMDTILDTSPPRSNPVSRD